MKVMYQDKVPKRRFRYISVTRMELFDDWNNQRNRYGIII